MLAVERALQSDPLGREPLKTIGSRISSRRILQFRRGLGPPVHWDYPGNCGIELDDTASLKIDDSQLHSPP
jgi:hypothetical protein